jgi:hypothetical protein
MQNAEPRKTISRPRLLGLLLFSAFIIHHSSFPAQATPTQEDVFKSIQTNVNDPVDGEKVLAFFAVLVGAAILIAVFNRRQKIVADPRPLNHQGKLVRELMKSAGLKTAQIRQLKALRDELAEQDQPVENLVTLLLCPSLIKKARDSQKPESRNNADTRR